MVESTAASKERNVYEHKVPIRINEYKISALDIHGKIESRFTAV